MNVGDVFKCPNPACPYDWSVGAMQFRGDDEVAPTIDEVLGEPHGYALLHDGEPMFWRETLEELEAAFREQLGSPELIAGVALQTLSVDMNREQRQEAEPVMSWTLLAAVPAIAAIVALVHLGLSDFGDES